MGDLEKRGLEAQNTLQIISFAIFVRRCSSCTLGSDYEDGGFLSPTNQIAFRGKSIF